MQPYRAQNSDSGEHAIVRMLERLKRADRRVQVVGTALVFLGPALAGALIGLMLKGC